MHKSTYTNQVYIHCKYIYFKRCKSIYIVRTYHDSWYVMICLWEMSWFKIIGNGCSSNNCWMMLKLNLRGCRKESPSSIGRFKNGEPTTTARWSSQSICLTSFVYFSSAVTPTQLGQSTLSWLEKIRKCSTGGSAMKTRFIRISHPFGLSEKLIHLSSNS